MRTHGMCRRCQRARRVQVEAWLPGGTAVGLCDECQEELDNEATTC